MDKLGKPGKAVEKPGKAAEKPGKAVEKPGKAVEKPGKAVEKPGKPLEKENRTMEKANQTSAKSTNSKSDEDPAKNQKPITKNMVCDVTPRAYKLAATKARIRSMLSHSPNYWITVQNYERHLAAVENAKHLVDCAPPRVGKRFYSNSTKYHKSLLQHTKIESGNARLLRNLAAIYSGEFRSETDNKLDPKHIIVKGPAYMRAVRTVELMHKNFKQYQWIQNVKPVYPTIGFAKWYAKQKKFADRVSKYPNQKRPLCPVPFRKVMEKAYIKPRQYAYMLVEVEDRQAENIIIELYADLCPFTVKNFQRLCSNTKATACDCRTYRCKKIEELHCVQVMDGGFKKLYWVVGEHVDSTVEYSQMMIKESTTISHTEAGLVTRPKNRAGGTFFITAAPCTHLDEFCYVFGRIDKKGKDFLKKMEERNTEENGQTIINMHITDCGILDSPENVPPPMLLHDFISQARLDVLPFIKRDPDHPTDWLGGKSDFAEYLKERAKEGRERHQQLTAEAKTILEYDDADPD